ncbi:NrdG2: anaerobic ribonucleoside-triphosphate reductase activating protein [compost metagenome]
MVPERLAQTLPSLDWVGLDIKAPAHRYDAITRTPGSGVRAAQSLRLLLDRGGLALECRTTWHAGLFSRDDLFRLADALAAQLVPHWVLQTCSEPGAPRDGLSASDLADLGARFQRFECR